MKTKKPELLAPAGSRAALEAAIEAGADAVYFGADAFNARMRAENFGAGEIGEAVKLARAYGVKTYITLNTRLFDGELQDALRLAATLYGDGADALIIADMGLAALIKKYIPDFEIHASTQLSGHSVYDAEALNGAGFSRMVCHREIDAAALKQLCSRSPIETEMFIHGAHCVSFSGQCLFSAVMGARSGNRGECAQPCRQPYSLGGGRKSSGKAGKTYPVSLRDMCLAGHITDILESGVASLKIEGRQKPAEYVYGVTKIYRRLIDEGRDALPEETEALRKIFSRGGFTAGYFEKNGADMRGVRTYEDFLEMDKTKFPGLSRKVPLKVRLTVKDGEAAVFEAESPTKRAEARGDGILDASSVAPLSREGAEKNAGRLGNTPFYLADFHYETDGISPLTLSELNRLRRRAVDALLSTKRNTPQIPNLCKGKNKAAAKTVCTAEFLRPEQIPEDAWDFFDKIFIPYGTQGGDSFDISLPPYMPDGCAEDVFCDKALYGKTLLCHTAGQLEEAVRRGYLAAASVRMNIFNSEAAEYCASLGEYVTLSPEVRLAKIRDMSCSRPIGAVVYGRLPLMLCVRCVLSDGGESCNCGGCGLSVPGMTKKSGALCTGSLTDRRGTVFPLYGMPDCTNILYNSVPVYMADRMREVQSAGVSVMHFIFTDESRDRCRKIIEAYKNGTPPESGNIRRML